MRYDFHMKQASKGENKVNAEESNLLANSDISRRHCYSICRINYRLAFSLSDSCSKLVAFLDLRSDFLHL